MHSYLEDTSYAAQRLFDALSNDAREVERLTVTMREAASRANAYHSVFLQRQRHPSVYFWYDEMRKADLERDNTSAQLSRLDDELADRSASLAVLASAVLQMAKQGISMVFGRPENCPNGRDVFGSQLKWVIWAGRNQAQHYEEPRLINEETERVFRLISAHSAGHLELDARCGVNLAFDIVRILGWNNYENYLRDMQLLLR